MASGRKQTTHTVLMVRPAAFGPNPETAETNAFQSSDEHLDGADIQAKALAEFEDFVAALREQGVRVLVANDTPTPRKPDAIFPNNWLAFHEDGRASVFPMFAPSRREERRLDILQAVADRFELKEAVDYSGEEAHNRFLEGTGSMTLDREWGIAYACESKRTNPEVLATFCKDFGYVPFMFEAVDRSNKPIYHTNVMMSLGSRIAIVCLDAIPNLRRQKELADQIVATGRTLIPISLEQMESFAGNVLELQSMEGKTCFAMSDQSFLALEPVQLELLSGEGAIIHSDLQTIEKYGGGSARCLLCEIFLDAKV